jgi:hypothetical protein
MKKSNIILIITMIIFSKANAQGVGINTVGLPANSNSMLDVLSNEKGILIPRMTTEQRNAIAVTGGNDIELLVYDRDKQRFYMYDGVKWLPLATDKQGGYSTRNAEATTVTSQGRFGTAADIDGEYAVVGAEYDSVGNKKNQGSAQVFRNISGVWTQMAELTANDGVAFDYFGHAVAISGNYIAVSAYKNDAGANEAGAVYVFFHSGTHGYSKPRFLMQRLV